MSDGFPEYKLLQKHVNELEQRMTSLFATVDNLVKSNQSTRASLDRLDLMVAGDDRLGLAGVVERLKAMETANTRIQAGLFLLGLINLGTLAVAVVHVL